MSKDNQNKKGIIGKVMGIITGLATLAGIVAIVYSFRNDRNQYSGDVDAIWQNNLLNNKETKTIVIYLENGAISLDTLIVTPTFVNTRPIELKGFSLSFEVECENITLTPTAVFNVTPKGKNRLFQYEKETLPSLGETPPTPFSSIKLNGSDGKCIIKSKATYNGIGVPFECRFDVLFHVVPNKSNLSSDQWKRTCDNYMKDIITDHVFYCQGNALISQKEVKPNNSVSGNNNGIVNNNQKVTVGFSHVFSPDSTCIVFTSKTKDVSFVVKLVEGGSYLMGAQSEEYNKPNYDEEAEYDEGPVHRVSLNSFYLGETEVTQELWRHVVGKESDCRGYSQGDNYPVYYVSFKDCQYFIERLNDLTDMNFRLPTEEEWEYAARGGKMSKGYKYAGGNIMDNLGWYCRNSGEEYLSGLVTPEIWNERKIQNKNRVHPVRMKDPNELGLYDMNGNVWEMCSNKFYLYSSNIQPNNVGNEYVQRGGSWGSDEWCCRVSCRGRESIARNATGFRLALSY